MRIGLVSYRCKNKDLAFNLGQIERAMRETHENVDLLCFGEAYLQGFDSLCWNYETDREMALETSSGPILQLAQWTEQYHTALLTGYIERAQERLYSSCIVLTDGKMIHNYRRISRGWKEFSKTDAHYAEGNEIGAFRFLDQSITLALCGDLWDFPERSRTDGLLIWPVYVDSIIPEWEQGELAGYAMQAFFAPNPAPPAIPLFANEAPHPPVSPARPSA